ncbi:MAG: NAD-dependent epimerase/dehydratase family protein [Bacteroidales bacterium]|nr:NAD-dependent epimerase/dehydratase family protein [Bacteroidales bacterium]
MRVGITGQNGFIGTHLFNFLNLDKNKFETVQFEDDYFEDQHLLEEWVTSCDVIVHLAAMCRHEVLDVVYNTNINLINKLIASLDKTNTKPHIIFTSSIQEELNSEYSKSKKEGRNLLGKWAKENNVPFTGMILPNVYGPLARPKYASVIATFSYQLTHNEISKIIVDAELKLIYINDLVKIILQCIINKENNPNYIVSFTDQKKVSVILNQLEYYNECYSKYGVMPEINSPFDFNLFNTFKSYIDHPLLPSK